MVHDLITIKRHNFILLYNLIVCRLTGLQIRCLRWPCSSSSHTGEMLLRRVHHLGHHLDDMVYLSMSLYSPMESLREPWATSWGRPMASSTWLGSREPEVQALPEEAQMPFCPASAAGTRPRCPRSTCSPCRGRGAQGCRLSWNGGSWKAPQELVPHGDQILAALASMFSHGFLQSRGHGHDAGHVLGAAALAALLGAALDEVHQRHALPGVQHAHALGGGTCGRRGSACRCSWPARSRGDGPPPAPRRCGKACAGAWQTADFGNRLMVPISLLANMTVTRQVSGRMAAFTCSSRHHAVLGDVQQRDLKAHALHALQAVQHRVVFKFRGDDVLFALLGSVSDRGEMA
jgi:hypothetical protein